jgi:UDP-glucose 4-epimerase
MKIVIFGGGGFIGSAIVDRLLLDGHHLRIFERPKVEPYRKFSGNERVEWMSGDILSVHDISLAFEDMDLAIHLVSTTLPKGSNDDPIYDVQSNLLGTLQILNTMVAMNVRKIIFISSGGTVYGTPQYLPINEEHPCEPQVSYGITKLAIEKYLKLYEKIHGLKTIILRVANPFGKRQRIETAQGAVVVFLHRALNAQPIEIWGDGSVIRDYIYIDDVAEIFARAVNYDGPKNVFNVSRGVGTSLNELIDIIEEMLGCTVERRYLPARNCDVPISILCNNLARQEMKWAPTVSLREGIKLTSEWMLEVSAGNANK